MAAVLVTGVSRSRGIAAAIAERLRADGFTTVTAGWTPYDTEQHAGIDEQTGSDLQHDLADPDEPSGCSRRPSSGPGRCGRWCWRTRSTPDRASSR